MPEDITLESLGLTDAELKLFIDGARKMFGPEPEEGEGDSVDNEAKPE